MKKSFLIVIVVLLLITGCSTEEQSTNNSENLLVYTSFYPLYFLADEIGGENIDLKIVVPNDVDSHGYEPSMNKLKDLERAQVFIYNGSGFESWADRLIGSIIEEEITINASDSVDIIMKDGRPDPHIWLNPDNMIKIGEKIKERFVSLDQDNKEEYEENYNEMSSKLKELDNRFLNELENKKKGSIIVSHEAFDYMAERYGFEQISVAGISPEQEPGPGTIANIIETAEDEDYEYIFLETLVNSKTVRVIADETGLEILKLNPIEGLTEEEQAKGKDYISIMEDNLKNLKKALVK